MTRIGFLGLGTMGAGMARRLLETGHDVLVWNRSTGPAAALAEAGAAVADSPDEALACAVSISMLANDEAATSVLGESSITRGATHINMATISPSLASRLVSRFEAEGAAYLASPVLGRPPVAAAGKLSILSAGARETFDEVQPILEHLGQRIWYLGPEPAQANAVKAAVNYNIIHAMHALGESIAMVERQGVDPGLFVEMLTSSLFGSVVYEGYGREIVEQAYKPAGFTMELGRKDLGLAEEVALAGGVHMPSLPVLKALFDRALEDEELKDADWGAIAEVTRRDLLP